MKRPTFALIGSTGYIAPRHIDAIKAIGGILMATLNEKEPLQKIKEFNNVKSFTSESSFFKYAKENSVDYISICSPSYLHFAHCKKSLEAGCDVICEKPVVLHLKEIEQLQLLEKKHKRKINAVFQLRFHEEIQKLKQLDVSGFTTANITIKTGRDREYFDSWKGDYSFSGGVKHNIGIHYFDLLVYLFGEIVSHNLEEESNNKIIGTLFFKGCKANYSIELMDEEICKHPIKVFTLGKKIIDLTNKENLHSKVYQEIVKNNGISIEEQKQFF